MEPAPPLTIPAAIDLALEHHRDGRFAEAEAIYRQVLAAQPDHADALHLLGALAHQLGRHDVAIALIGRAIAADPRNADYHSNLGEALRALGRLDDAVASFRRALALRPHAPDCAGNLAAALVQLGRADDAIALCETTLAHGARSAPLLNNLGIALKEAGRSTEAIARYRELLAAQPDYVEAHENLANALRQQGRIDEALEWLDRALTLRPASLRLQRSYLAGLLYREPRDEAALHEAHLRFGRCAMQPADALDVPLHRDRDPDRRLRVGFLSCDLREHPAARSIRPWFSHHDRRAMALVAYAEVVRPDAESRWLQQYCDEWHSTVGLSDRGVAALVRAHRIDILILATGHFDDNRPGVAGWRAAPVQITGWDVATSGIAAMDYALVDPIVSPPDSAEPWIETRLHLPSIMNYERPDDAPAPGPLPAASKGHVTFGSFNNPTKINPAVVALWCRVLQRLPDARLILKCADRYADAAVRERYRAMFAEHAITDERLEIRTRGNPRAEHLADYREIDIGLDCFPFTGATTTFEALVMGVPVVTLARVGVVERISASILHAVGLDGLAAATPEGFVDAAIGLAADLPALARLRAALRDRLAASAVCDSAGHARALDGLLRQVWRARCAADRGA